MCTIPLQNFSALVAGSILNDDELEIGIALMDHGSECRFEVLRIADNGSNDRGAGKWRRGDGARICVWRHRENCLVALPNGTRLYMQWKMGLHSML
jgi:hypothetical protein